MGFNSAFKGLILSSRTYFGLNFRREKYPDTHGIGGWAEPQNRAERNEV